MKKRYVTGRVKAIDTDARTLTAYASTADLDRDGDVIQPEAWRHGLSEFNQNPVLLWAHDYRVPPIGKAVDLKIDGRGLKFTASFARTDFADEVWGLYRDGFLNAFSVGFQPKAWEEREDSEGLTFTETQLMEISAVPVPANPHALVERGVPVIAVKSVDTFGGVPEATTKEAKGVIPTDVSRETAERGVEWEAPTLSDFTDQRFEELSDEQKRRIAGHFAWAAQMPPENYGELKGPHHRPSDGAVVWNAITNLAARLNQMDIPDADVADVRAHVASHYEQFDETAPWERSADNATDEEINQEGEEPVESLSEAEAERDEPDSGQATRSDDAPPVTDADTEPEIDEDAIAEALTPFFVDLTGELLNE